MEPSSAMSSKRSRLTTSPTDEVPKETPQRQARNSATWSLCLVCGDRANIVNYGGLSCQSCKTFFRRNGFHPEGTRVCLFNKVCDIKKNTRRACTACRLSKCFAVGMSSHLIRKEDKHLKGLATLSASCNEAVLRKQITTAERDTQRVDRILSNSSWILIGDILLAHDTFSVSPQIRQMVDRLSTFPVRVHFKQTDAFESLTLLYISMHFFVNTSPDFRHLSPIEQGDVLERNLHAIVGLSSLLVCRETSLLDHSQCFQVFETIYGFNLTLQTNRLSKCLDPDATLVKLMLIVMSFSSNFFVVEKDENIFDDRLVHIAHRLLECQTRYTELMWNYAIHQFGDRDAVHRCTRLIGICLNWMKSSAMAYMNVSNYRTLVDDLVQKTKHSPINDNTGSAWTHSHSY